MYTLASVGVGSVMEEGPRVDSQSGRNLRIASYKLVELLLVSCSCVSTVPFPDVRCRDAPAHPESHTTTARTGTSRRTGRALPKGNAEG